MPDHATTELDFCTHELEVSADPGIDIWQQPDALFIVDVVRPSHKRDNISGGSNALISLASEPLNSVSRKLAPSLRHANHLIRAVQHRRTQKWVNSVNKCCLDFTYKIQVIHTF